MANPQTVTLVANTAQDVTFPGCYSSLVVRPLTASQVVYARGDGTTAVGAADGCWAATDVLPTRVPCVFDGTNTVVSVISATAGPVQVSTYLMDLDNC